MNHQVSMYNHNPEFLNCLQVVQYEVKLGAGLTVLFLIEDHPYFHLYSHGFNIFA